MSNILALDQSSYTTGYCIIADSQLVTYGHYTASGDALGKRLTNLKKKIQQLIEQYNINEVVFEDIQLQKINGQQDNVKTFKVLAEVIGMLEQYFTEQKIQYKIIQPNVWKATFKIAGKGRAQEKKLAQQEVLKRYAVDCTEDEADAICLGTHHALKSASDWNWA